MGAYLTVTDNANGSNGNADRPYLIVATRRDSGEQVVLGEVHTRGAAAEMRNYFYTYCVADMFDDGEIPLYTTVEVELARADPSVEWNRRHPRRRRRPNQTVPAIHPQKGAADVDPSAVPHLRHRGRAPQSPCCRHCGKRGGRHSSMCDLKLTARERMQRANAGRATQ